MNPAKDVEYPDLVGTPDEPVEPSNEADPDPAIPAEHALDKKNYKKADLHPPDANTHRICATGPKTTISMSGMI